MEQKFEKLEDYGLIGDLETSALISKNGSIDWLCLPNIDSPSVFAAILDAERGGFFKISPAGRYGSHQRYINETNILETAFDTKSGSLILTDFMPVRQKGSADNSAAIFRKINCTRGQVEVKILFQPRFDYGRANVELRSDSDHVLAKWKDERLFLRSPVVMSIADGSARCALKMEKSDTFWFILYYGEEFDNLSTDCDKILDETIRFWMDWLHKPEVFRPSLQGPWHDMVIRSILILKLLSNANTGAILAAPTTSLPEKIGGIRNWDYRYSWVRDASFTIQAFEQLGFLDEALEYFEWLRNVTHADAKIEGTENIKIAYTFDGKNIPAEETLDHLSGYMNSKPVRTGNAAFCQDQLDIFGEIISTFYLARRHRWRAVEQYWSFIQAIANHVCEAWDVKDSGIWEFRFARRHLVHSKLMCWVALDRSIKMAREHGLDAPLDHWERSRDSIRRAILEKGFSNRLNSFIQAFDYEVLDATSLLIPIMGFLPPDDPRVKGTIDAISKGLCENGLLRRYEGDDGLPGQEGVFVICSFWLVQALAMTGDRDRARQEFMRILKYRSPLGLFSEEIATESGLLTGNYPQAFSHIGLINAALYLGEEQGKEKPGPELLGLSAERPKIK
jgi:alpha,alpha-trehalase